MSRKPVYFFLAVILAACATPVDKGQQTDIDQESQSKASEVQKQPPVKVDTTRSKVTGGIDTSGCPTFFKVFRHNANECYVNLCFRSGMGATDDWEKLQKKCDSTVFGADEMRRARVPENEAARVLEIDGIRDVKIYGTSGLMLPASFIRVEYFEDLISGSFTAVFQSADSLNSDSNLYAVLPDSIDSFVFKNGSWKCVTVGNEAKEDSVLGLVNNTYSTQWFFQTDDMTSSFSLSHSSFSTSVSSEFLSFGSTYQSVYELRDFHVGLANITRAFPTHYYSGNWPVWIVEVSVPETDRIYFQAVVPVNEDNLEISKNGKLCVK